MKKTLIVLLALALILEGGLWGYRRYQALERERADEDRPAVASVERRTIETKIEATGDITPATQVDVKPEVSARIRDLPVSVGQKVKKGMMLVQLDDTELLTEKKAALNDVAGAQVALDKSMREYERAKRLFENKLYSQEVFENAKTDLDTAKNSFTKAQTELQTVADRLDKTKVPSPMEGTILTLPVVDGQVVIAAASVSSGTLLMTIADLSRMYISCHINQVDVAKVQVKEDVLITVDSVRGLAMHGEVVLVSPIANIKNTVKGFDVTVAIKDLDPRIRPGMTADVTFPVAKVANVLALPISAIHLEEGGTKIVYLPPNGPEASPQKKTVQVGVSNYDYAEIKSGLKEGEEVLLYKPSS